MRRVLITGGSGSLGQALIEKLLPTSQILNVDLNPSKIKSNNLKEIHASVLDFEKIQEEIESWLENNEIDLAFFLAGSAKFEKFNFKSIQISEVHFIGSLKAAQFALEHSRNGTLVFMGSLSSELSLPFLTTYSAAKAGIFHFAKCLREELKILGRPIRVLTVRAGVFRSEMTEKQVPKKLKSKLKFLEDSNQIANEIMTAIEHGRKEDLILTKNGKLLFRLKKIQSFPRRMTQLTFGKTFGQKVGLSPIDEKNIEI